jgi:hypothetical protein
MASFECLQQNEGELFMGYVIEREAKLKDLENSHPNHI